MSSEGGTRAGPVLLGPTPRGRVWCERALTTISQSFHFTGRGTEAQRGI